MSSSDSDVACGVGPGPGPLSVLSTGAEEEVELVPVKEEEEQEMVETGKKEEDGDVLIESDSKKLRGEYFSSAVLVVRILLCSLDHLSDLLVVTKLWQDGHKGLAIAGIAIDLLPGPVVVAHFLRLGYPRWRCASLAFHPANYYLHTAMAALKKDEDSAHFSRLVALHSREAQGLLEAPMQLIFTTTLIMLRILPTPFDEFPVLENSFGFKIELSFYPVVSAAFSFLMITVNAVLNNVSNDTAAAPEGGLQATFQRILAWFALSTSTVLFRIHVWVLLFSFIGEFALVPFGIQLAGNVVIILFLADLSVVEPVNYSLYTMLVPITNFQSSLLLRPEKEIAADRGKVKRTTGLLTLWSSSLLIAWIWMLKLALYLDLFSYSPQIRMRRDAVLPSVAVATLAGVLALLSAALVFASEHTKEGEEEGKNSPKGKSRSLNYVKILASSILLLLAFASHGYVLLHGNGEEQFVKLDVTFHCRYEEDQVASLVGYSHRNIQQPRGDAELHYAFLSALDESYGTAGLDNLGFLNGSLPLLVDWKPASPLPPEFENSPAILLVPGDLADSFTERYKSCNSAKDDRSIFLVDHRQFKKIEIAVMEPSFDSTTRDCSPVAPFPLGDGDHYKTHAAGAFLGGKDRAVLCASNQTDEDIHCFDYVHEENRWELNPDFDMSTKEGRLLSSIFSSSVYFTDGSSAWIISRFMKEYGEDVWIAPNRTDVAWSNGTFSRGPDFPSLGFSARLLCQVSLNSSTVLFVFLKYPSVEVLSLDVPSLGWRRVVPGGGAKWDGSEDSAFCGLAGREVVVMAKVRRATMILDLESLQWRRGPMTNLDNDEIDHVIQLETTFLLALYHVPSYVLEFDPERDNFVAKQVSSTLQWSDPIASFLVPDRVAFSTARCPGPI